MATVCVRVQSACLVSWTISIQVFNFVMYFGQFIRYNVVIRVTTPVSGGVTTLVQPNIFVYMMQNSARMAAAELSLL